MFSSPTRSFAQSLITQALEANMFARVLLAGMAYELADVYIKHLAKIPVTIDYCAYPHELKSFIKRFSPEILVVYMGKQGTVILSDLKRIIRANPGLRVIVVSHSLDFDIHRFMELGIIRHIHAPISQPSDVVVAVQHALYN